MLEDLRKQAQEKLDKNRAIILKDPEAAEYFSAYMRLTGDADIFDAIPENLSVMKKSHAKALRERFMKKAREMPEFAAITEAKTLLETYKEKLEEPVQEEFSKEKPKKTAEETHESGELSPPGGIWDEDRVQVIKYVEEDPFAFLDEGLDMQVKDPEPEKEDELLDLEPDAPVIISHKTEHEKPATPQREEKPKESSMISDQPEPAETEAEEDEEEKGSLVTSEGISQYNRITSDIEAENRQEEIEKSSFVDGINTKSQGIEEEEKEEITDLPREMYYNGQKVSRAEYEKLLQNEQAQASQNETSCPMSDHKQEKIHEPESADFETASDEPGPDMQNAADFNGDMFNDDMFNDDDESDRSAAIASFAEKSMPGGVGFDDEPDFEKEPKAEFEGLPEPDENLVASMMEMEEPEEPDEPDFFKEPEASESCIENLENFMNMPAQAKDDILERTAKANPMREETPPAPKQAPPKPGAAPKKKVHSWNLEGMYKTTTEK